MSPPGRRDGCSARKPRPPAHSPARETGRLRGASGAPRLRCWKTSLPRDSPSGAPARKCGCRNMAAVPPWSTTPSPRGGEPGRLVNDGGRGAGSPPDARTQPCGSTSAAASGRWVFTGPQFVSLDVSRYPAVFWQQWLNGCSGRLEWNEQARRDRVLKPREAEVFVEPSGILILRIDDGRAHAYHRFTDRADPDQGVN